MGGATKELVMFGARGSGLFGLFGADRPEDDFVICLSCSERLFPLFLGSLFERRDSFDLPDLLALVSLGLISIGGESLNLAV